MDIAKEEAPLKTLNITKNGSVAVLGNHMMSVEPNGEGRVYSDARVARDFSDTGRDTDGAAHFHFNEALDELVVLGAPFYGEFDFSFESSLNKLSAYGTAVEHNPKGGLIVYTDADCQSKRTPHTFNKARIQSSIAYGRLCTVIGNAYVEIGSGGDITLHTNEPVIVKPAAKAPKIEPGSQEFYANNLSIGMYGSRMETRHSDQTSLTLYSPSEDIGIAPGRQPGDTMPDYHQYAGKIYLGTLDNRQGPLYIDPENTAPMSLSDAKKTADIKGGFIPGPYTAGKIHERTNPHDLLGLQNEFAKTSTWLSERGRTDAAVTTAAGGVQYCVDPETLHSARICYTEKADRYGYSLV